MICHLRKINGSREDAQMPAQLVVSVVDDDESVRESLPPLLEALGFVARAFTSAEAFLGSDAIARTSCLILDITMPGMSGVELYRELKVRGCNIPVIFITARGNGPLRQGLLEEGAVECLDKPFDDTALLQALKKALAGG
jgi:FixJ family two-component response regulator